MRHLFLGLALLATVGCAEPTLADGDGGSELAPPVPGIQVAQVDPDEPICVPAGAEWVVDLDLTPVAQVRGPDGTPAIAALGRHSDRRVLVVITLDGEIMWVDPDYDSRDPGFERGPDCTWRLVNEQTQTKGEYAPGAFAKRGQRKDI